MCDVVFAEDGYTASVNNLKAVSLTSDNVFSDGHATQLGSVEGSVNDGYEVSLDVDIAA